jgi:heat-inducible transcriptional repressor
MQITKRQEKILQIIVEQYAFTAQPISSQEIISEHLDDISSATVRNEMVILEKKGLLEKTHTSSGRIPSVDAYKYYEANILKPKINNDVKKKLKKIFALRDLSIDTVIDQSISIINESLKLPSVISSTVNIESLKRFDLIQISADTALIIIVTSSGEIIKNEITLDNASQLADVSTCIRIFNDRLLDTPIKDVSNKLSSIKEIIRTAVHEYEFCIQQIFEKIFSFNTNNSQKRTVVGTKYLTAQPEFRNIEKLNEALGFLENTNV